MWSQLVCTGCNFVKVCATRSSLFTICYTGGYFLVDYINNIRGLLFEGDLSEDTISQINLNLDMMEQDFLLLASQNQQQMSQLEEKNKRLQNYIIDQD